MMMDTRTHRHVHGNARRSRGAIRTTLALVLLAAIPAGARGQKPAGFDAAWRDVAARYHRTLDDNGVVGGALWFVRGGDLLAREFHGFADLETRRKVDENTIFHWASITKTFTGIAILQLRDRGLLSLDDPIVKYLPELRMVHDTFGPVDDITLRMLMQHSAGFRNPTWPWGGDQPWHPFEPTEWSQIVAMLPYTEILFEPGSRHSYSNPGIIFLGRVIEILSGDDFEVYIDKNILKPLGITHSYFDVTPYFLLPYRSNNYTVRDGRPVANGLDFDTGITTSNGGLNAPITDMAKYLAFLAGDASNPVYDVVLKRSSLEGMWRKQLDITPASDTAKTREGIGLIWFVLDHGPVHVIGHTGSQASFRAFVYLDPASGAAAIAQYNTVRATPRDRPDTDRLLTNLREDLFEHVFPLFR
jgi:CubicO group peptidase (beta-lactamase class C family)